MLQKPHELQGVIFVQLPQLSPPFITRCRPVVAEMREMRERKCSNINKQPDTAHTSACKYTHDAPAADAISRNWPLVVRVCLAIADRREYHQITHTGDICSQYVPPRNLPRLRVVALGLRERPHVGDVLRHAQPALARKTWGEGDRV